MAEEREANELRCGCGSLIARVNRNGIEIKCRRCKSIKFIPLSVSREVIKMRWFKTECREKED
ncbi:MAG: hypothetical protein A2X87_06235 [Deltaproteobacteria bacterium GWC2_42_51]|nr:MAG: hypothetical protein A2067_01755 [Deltaproteobacteria bacterium GWB2_42_7]OGP35352.1 MAG: hypothetical protein A2X87_06235 [Deltaproteobacteria bacterium GWC2_42_51]OGP38288.1 MAG: hypothetical protein A2090_06225 [Deltaproteobacteria bacterium GWD2_42_10]OGP48451.1 MAG: hypothetical protein A2022_05415 [Deltaproteobacteria bacterium GWF2_42_12]OGQ25497.1 MAG: hypothetical protein A3D29_03975 [Deltaproteobacteria bacterium RIFCSPHIGHO2_02_FULL_42_44]OGQ37463.1 MAG: hypothetical protein